MSGIKFYACTKCWERGCEPTPDDDTTRFSRGVSARSYGTRQITFDEDGDIQEGDAEGFEDTDDYEDDDYYACYCCQHENYDEGVVALWMRDRDEKVFTYSHAEELGWTEDDYEDDEDDDEDEVVATPIVINTGRALSASATDIADAISAAALDVTPTPDTHEIEIVFTQ